MFRDRMRDDGLQSIDAASAAHSKAGEFTGAGS
jgi:hypothetical protein